MHHLASTRSTLRASAVLAAAVLAACGSSRKVSEGGDVCVRCHGDTGRTAPAFMAEADARLLRASPPKGVSGGTTTTAVAVGAHQAHVVGGRLRGPTPCTECHVVPAGMAQHEADIARIAAGTMQRVTFGPLADKGAAVATWNTASERCNGTYCHGATINHGGLNHDPKWTNVDPTTHPEARCGDCHGYPPALPHPQLPSPIPAGYKYCGECHSKTTADGFTIAINAGVSTHIDGVLTIDATACAGDCTCCHGGPPATGAHAAHVTSAPAAYGVDSKTSDTLSTSATTYDFGCGNCHPLDENLHNDSVVEVDLSPVNASGFKARNASAAAYNAADKTCAGVYCHSTGQATPAFVASPGWFSGATLGCAGCHANPPNYANGGTAAATANSHVGLVTESDGLTYEVGHFGGFPAMMHDWSRHGRGANDSSPITCQSCHSDTVDETNAGPSGVYYLDTTGDYDLGGTGRCFGGVGPSCTGGTFIPAYACTNCHTGTPPAQGGLARPYFHVNGTRDVVFDSRTTVSAPAPLNALLAPTRRYWLTAPGVFSAVDTTGHLDATALVGGVPWSTLSLNLLGAQWNASTKTCSSVDCHFNRTSVQWGEPLSSSATTGSCVICHNF